MAKPIVHMKILEAADIADIEGQFQELANKHNHEVLTVGELVVEPPVTEGLKKRYLMVVTYAEGVAGAADNAD